MLRRGHGRSRRSASTSASRAPTPRRQRVALVLDELERTGAFDRAVAAGRVADRHRLRELRRGDRARAARARRLRDGGDAVRGATVGAVARPGPRRPQAGAAAARRAAARGSARSPRPTRPKFVLFGESLGAWTSQDPFVDRGTQGLVDTGHRPRDLDRHAALQQVEGAGAVRRPRRRRRRASSGCSTTSASGTRSTPRTRAKIRYVMITHHDDGVALFGPELAIQAPEWLGPPDDPPVVGAEGDALDADHHVLPGARRHEELGQRRPGQVRGEGPRLPRRPAPVLPRHARLRRHRRAARRHRHLARARGAASAASGSRRTAQPGRASRRRSSSRRSRDLHEQGLDPDERLAQIVAEIAGGQFGAGGGADIPTPSAAPGLADGDA